MSETPSRKPIGEPSRINTTETPCPDCGVVQEVEVWSQDFENSVAAHYVDRECPICGFNDVWF
jgi:predicted RNA-binding Zn-ribbon protein involved in translation (DUF1610 family)